jgi:uncharacterized repeat protein (TIGR01451 family)
MQLLKDDGGVSVGAGETITYTLTFANTGPQGATGVVITDTVPVGTSFNAAASTGGWVCVPDVSAGSVCSIAIGSVTGGGGGGQLVFAVDVVVPLPSEMTLVVNAAAIGDDGTHGPDPNPGDNFSVAVTPLEAAPDLQVLKDDGVAVSVGAGETISYTVTFTNAGTQDATGVVITDTVPVGTTFNAAASTAGWQCVPDVSAGSECSFALGAVGGAGGGGQIVFAVDVDNPLPAGQTEVANTVAIADDGSNGPDPNPGDNTDTETTPVVIPVDIDIKPGSEPNSINCDSRNMKKGVIPVAILTTDTFDATTVDHTTVEFEGATESHRRRGQVQRHEKDVDGDGDIDLLLHFKLKKTSLDCTSTSGSITGQTFAGHNILGTDSIRMIQ